VLVELVDLDKNPSEQLSFVQLPQFS